MAPARARTGVHRGERHEEKPLSHDIDWSDSRRVDYCVDAPSVSIFLPYKSPKRQVHELYPQDYVFL